MLPLTPRPFLINFHVGLLSYVIYSSRHSCRLATFGATVRLGQALSVSLPTREQAAQGTQGR